MDDDRWYWIAWSQIPGIGPMTIARLKDRFGSLKVAWESDSGVLTESATLKGTALQQFKEYQATVDIDRLAETYARDNPNFWTPADDLYPTLLREIPAPPCALHYTGNVDLTENWGETLTVGIVGTRDPSEYGMRWTKTIAKVLAAEGVCIVSGLARGIDSIAHSACLEAGSRTIAVVGSGLDIIYPPENKALFRQIQERGTIVSEYPKGTSPDRGHFPQRNRIIAGLSRVILVMEAPQKSGALITAYAANDYGREIFVLPGSLDNPRCFGGLELISHGAHPILGVESLLERLLDLPNLTSRETPTQEHLAKPAKTPRSAAAKKTVPPPTTPPPQLPANMARIFDILPAEPTVFDTIVDLSNLPPHLVSSSLLELELMGLIVQLPGMHYQKLHR
jgi:DNA processing protein